MNGKRISRIPFLAAALLAGLLSGCAGDARYVAAPSAPPADLALGAKDGSLRAELHHVIVRDGPGTWVKGAPWDEYVLTVQNLSGAPVTVTRVRLIDPRGVYIENGANPGQLEKLSETLAKAYRNEGIGTAIMAAPTVATYAAVTTGATGALSVVGAVPLLGPIAALAGGAFSKGAQQEDIEDKERITAEFRRRRLPLPGLTLAAKASVRASAFFPVVPSPKALVFDYRAGGRAQSLSVPLDKLAGLHAAPAGKRAQGGEQAGGER